MGDRGGYSLVEGQGIWIWEGRRDSDSWDCCWSGSEARTALIALKLLLGGWSGPGDVHGMQWCWRVISYLWVWTMLSPFPVIDIIMVFHLHLSSTGNIMAFFTDCSDWKEVRSVVAIFSCLWPELPFSWPHRRTVKTWYNCMMPFESSEKHT